jgi:hypothetical protein
MRSHTTISFEILLRISDPISPKVALSYRLTAPSSSKIVNLSCSKGIAPVTDTCKQIGWWNVAQAGINLEEAGRQQSPGKES